MKGYWALWVPSQLSFEAKPRSLSLQTERLMMHSCHLESKLSGTCQAKEHIPQVPFDFKYRLGLNASG